MKRSRFATRQRGDMAYVRRAGTMPCHSLGATAGNRHLRCADHADWLEVNPLFREAGIHDARQAPRQANGAGDCSRRSGRASSGPQSTGCYA